MYPVYFGVREDVSNVGAGPAPNCSAPGNRHRRWVGCQVAVESIGDCLVAQAFIDSPCKRLAHGVRPLVGDFQEGLFDPFGSLGWHRVRDLASAVAVGWLAHVVSLLGVNGEPVPRLFQQVIHEGAGPVKP
jgi:hypothetical protein